MSKYVHNLIASMTMREKGYFKMTSSVKGNKPKNYLQLYNYVEKTPIYDAIEVKAKFENTTIGKYLSSEYNYLAEQLMKSLVNFNFDKSDKNKIHKSVLFINILIEKGLKKKALKVLNHKKKLAYYNEFFSQVLTLIDLEEEILFRQGVLGFTDKLKNMELERQKLIDKINNLNKLRLLREQIRELWFNEGYLNQKLKRHPILRHKLLESEENALSCRAREHWQYIVSMRAFIIQNHTEAVAQFLKGINFIETNTHLFNQNNLLVFISNYMYNCALAKDYSSFQLVIGKLTALKDNIYAQYILYCRSLEIYYQLKAFNKIEVLVTEIHSFMACNITHLELTQSNYIFFLLARNSIMIRDFEKTLDCINQWLHIKQIEFYHLHVKMFLLIIYLELDFKSLLSSGINSSIKVLISHKQYNWTAQKMISFFKSVLRYPKKELYLLERLKSELTDIRKGDKDKSYKYFNYSLWVNSRIGHISK